MKTGDLVRDTMTGQMAIVTDVQAGQWVEIRYIEKHSENGWSRVYLPSGKLEILSKS